jgi:hypothetical protein
LTATGAGAEFEFVEELVEELVEDLVEELDCEPLVEELASVEFELLLEELCVTDVVSATAVGSSFALAKIDPARMIAPVATSAASGSFLLTLRIPVEALSPSDSSNHSGFFGVIVDLFPWQKSRALDLKPPENGPQFRW